MESNFVDYVKIMCRSGKGGKGSMHLRHVKYNPHGGPDGGDGGKGGSIILRGQQSGRADDNEETIKKRLVVYHSQTQPLIEWYKKEGLHHHINGLGTLERIFADIQKVIDNI